VQGLSMRVKKTQHSQRWINTLFFISISTFKPIPIYIYIYEDPCSHINSLSIKM
jgi:hypothetical protein